MKPPLILILFLSIALSSYAKTIRGIITDAETGKPVEFVTVYIDGTSVGTISDNKGIYSLNYDFERFKVVFTHISYKSVVLQVDASTLEAQPIEMTPRQIMISEFNVESKSRRQQHIKYFKKVFLGTDKWGKSAEILNDSVLFFNVRYTNKEQLAFFDDSPYSYFEVSATEPLQIRLPKTGYNLEYTMVEFVVSRDTGLEVDIVNNFGFTYFKEIEDVSNWRKRSFRRNRYKAYYHSTMHFIRSLYQNKLEDNGYEVLTYNDNDSIQNSKYHLVPFILDSCDCLKYEGDKAYLTGMKDKRLVIYYYTNGYKPVNLKKFSRDENGRIILFRSPFSSSGLYVESDTCLIRKDGTLPGDRNIVFSNAITEKRFGAALPVNFNP